MNAYFNELCVARLGTTGLQEKFQQLCVLLSALSGKGIHNVVTPADFAAYQLTPSISMNQLLNRDDMMDPEQKTQILDMMTTVDSDILGDADILEARVGDFSCIGFGMASAEVANTIAISIDATVWNQPTYKVTLLYLDKDAKESVRETTCRHAATPTHLRDFQGEVGQEPSLPQSGKILYNQLSTLFPHLVFSDQAKTQIKENKNVASTEQIYKKLKDIENAAATRTRGPLKPSMFSSLASPESFTRDHLSELNVLFADGVKRHCSWHLRYTPGKGRIHIAVDEDSNDSVIFVGYVGNKIGV